MTTSYKLLVLPGDGIGPEVMSEVLKVASCIEDLSSVNFEIEQETPELFNPEENNVSDDSMSSDDKNDFSEEDELEIPAFLRRQKN